MIKNRPIFVFAILILAFNACKKEELNPNFSYLAYDSFLSELFSNPDIVVEPLYRFDSVEYPDKILVGLRHDIDVDLWGAVDMANYEKQYNFRATYFVLHTADYYLSSGITVHNNNLLPILDNMQKQNHEIGWHNDLVTLQVIYNKNPITFFNNELKWLRDNNIKIFGSASHGSDNCEKYGYHNHYFFNEFSEPAYEKYPNNKVINVNGKGITINKGNMKQFNLNYEAYHIKYNRYYSDCSFPNGNRWYPGMIDFSTWKKGDRIVILTHPTHWHP